MRDGDERLVGVPYDKPESIARSRPLPEHDLRKTGPVDEADWNYRPVLNYISRQRFELVLELLDETPAHDLLEIGYGSGVFAPELARRTKSLWGIDIHHFKPK